jgi:hypothetical protein
MKLKAKRRTLFAALILLPAFTLISCSQSGTIWRKGNMHTHSFWSDGDDFPESVARWYKENGYDFLALTDHNVILEGERWRDIPNDHPALKKYLEDYDSDWVDTQPAEEEGHTKVRLKTLQEFRSLYEEPGEFLIIMGNEITSPHAVHFLAFQQNKIIPAPQGSAEERIKMMRETVDNIAAYRAETGINVYPVLAHPNFRWAITAEMMLKLPTLRFFEVCNYSSECNNEGSKYRADTERMWDIVLSQRLASGNNQILYGLATDDTHNYHGGSSGPGKGWIMVRSTELTPEAILSAMNTGDFYASSGVTVNDIQCSAKTIRIQIKPEKDVSYKTEFIGTMQGFDSASTPTTDAEGNEIPNTTRTYSPEIGRVLAESQSLDPVYTFTGRELYVRIRITSTADHIDPTTGDILGKQKAWLQPHIPRH